MQGIAKETKALETTLKPTTNLLKDMGSAATNAGIALTATFTAPILAVAGLGIQFNAMQEQAQIAFTTMLGDGNKAKAFLGELKDFAAQTPFEFPDLVRASQRLMAMGFAADDVKPLLTAVGDAVAGLGGGAAEIDRVTLALGQMQGRGKVATQEMNQLTEVGIPAWAILAKNMGITEMALRDMVEKGAVPAGAAVEALIEGMTEKFGGMSAKQAKTFSGLISTIKDESRFLAAELTTGLFEAIKGPALAFAEGLHVVRMAMSGMSAETKTIIVVVAGIAAAIGPVLLVFGTLAGSLSNIIGLYGKLKGPLTAGIKLFTNFGSAVGFLTSPLGIAVIAITAFATVAYLVYQNWDTVGPKIIAIWEAIKDGAAQIWGVIKSGIEAVTSKTREIWAKYGDDIKLIWDTIKGFAFDMWNRIADLAIAGIRIVSSIIANGLKAIAGVFEVALGILSGNWRMAWDGIKLILSAAWGVIKDTVVAIFRFTLSEVQRLIDAVAGTARSLGSALPGILGKPLLAIGSALDSASESVGNYSKSMDKGVQASGDFGKKISVVVQATNEQKEATKAVISIWDEYYKKQAAAGKAAAADALAAAEAAKKAAADAKTFQNAVDNLKESVTSNTDKNRQLIAAVQQLSAAHVSATAIAKALGGPISDLVDQLEREGKAIPPVVKAIADLVKLQESLKSDMELTSAGAQVFTTRLEEQKRAYDSMNRAMDDPKMVELNKAFRDSQMLLARLAGISFPNFTTKVKLASNYTETLVEFVGPELSIAAGESEAALNSLLGVAGKLGSLEVAPSREQWDASIKKAKEFEQAWATAMANLNTRTAEALADALISGGNFGKKMVDIAKDTAKGMLSAFLSGLISPLTDAFGRLGQKAAGILSDNVLSKLPGFGSAAGGVASGAGSAGSAAGGAGGVASAASSGVMGTVGAVAGVVDAVASIGVIFQLKRIEGTMNAVEANTRYSQIQLKDTMEQILWPMHGLVNFIAQQATKSVELLDSISWSTMFSYQFLESISQKLGAGSVVPATVTEPRTAALPDVRTGAQAQTTAPNITFNNNYDIDFTGVTAATTKEKIEELKRWLQTNQDGFAAEIIKTFLTQAQGQVARG